MDWKDITIKRKSLILQVPSFSKTEEAKKAVEAARLPPGGNREVCRFVKAAHLGSVPKASYFEEANTTFNTSGEGNQGIENLDEIVEISRDDILFIDPYDFLSIFGYSRANCQPEDERS